MDFYSILKASYREGLTPFELYSQMCDLCKGDLKLKEMAKLLYTLYTRRDIFEEIALCGETDFGGGLRFSLYVKEFSKQEQKCLVEVARLLRPNWIFRIEEGGDSIEKGKTSAKDGAKAGAQQATSPATVTPAKAVVNTSSAQRNIPPVKTPKPAPKPKAEIDTVQISSLVSDLDVKTSASAASVEVRILQGGIWTPKKKGIGKRGTMFYVNLDDVVAEKIEVTIPQRKFATLHVDKAHGELTVIDRADCFKKVRLLHEVGKVRCDSSAPTLYVGGRAVDVELKYTAHENGSVDIRNTLGDIKIALRNVGKIEDKMVSARGRVYNVYQPSGSNEVQMKVITNYGNITVM